MDPTQSRLATARTRLRAETARWGEDERAAAVAEGRGSAGWGNGTGSEQPWPLLTCYRRVLSERNLRLNGSLTAFSVLPPLTGRGCGL
jgi:hypothetical protein